MTIFDPGHLQVYIDTTFGTSNTSTPVCVRGFRAVDIFAVSPEGNLPSPVHSGHGRALQ